MEQFYTISQFSKLINVKIKTLQKWDRDGILKAKRTITNRRYYTHSQYLDFIGESNNIKRNNVIYARVSNRSQLDDLKNQISFINNFIINNGLEVNEIYSDIGSGLNFKRKKWNELIEEAIQGKINKIYISHKDRFIRFGFDWFESFLRNHYGTEIIVIENIATSPQEDLIQDLISIIHVFSCRVYGLRKYKSKLKEKFLCKSNIK